MGQGTASQTLMYLLNTGTVRVLMAKSQRQGELIHPGHSVPVMTPSQSREHLLCRRSSEHILDVPYAPNPRTQTRQQCTPKLLSV